MKPHSEREKTNSSHKLEALHKTANAALASKFERSIYNLGVEAAQELQEAGWNFDTALPPMSGTEVASILYEALLQKRITVEQANKVMTVLNLNMPGPFKD